MLKYYDAAVTQTEMKNGLLFYNGQPFSGILYRLQGKDTLFRAAYLHGLEDGLHKFWYDDGRLKELHFYTAGKKTGTHTGYWPGGQKMYERSYKDDMYDGVERYWFENGQLCQLFHYKDGHEDGMQQVWTEDGAVLANYEARNGRNYGNIGDKHCATRWKK